MTAHRKVTVKEAQTIAVGALSFLSGDDRRLSGFLDSSGLRPDTLRAAAASRGFFAAVLDYVAADEALLVDVAASLKTTPESIMAARFALSPTEFE